MNFNIDQQSLDELNLLGKFRQGSVYHLFNQVKTRGGEKLLDEMFRQPLIHETVINQRTAIFHFFQCLGLKFPFSVQQVGLMREYLDTGAGKGLIATFASTLAMKLLSLTVRDERYKTNIQGLQATIEVLKSCHNFISTIGVTSDSAFAARIQEIKDLLYTPRLEKLRNTDIYKALSVQTLVHYDLLLKTHHHEDMENMLSFIHEVDVYIAVSSVAATRAFVYAKALTGARNMLSVKELRHPAIENAVGNSLMMNEASNMLFLTGANMAGKSTLMKSLGISLYLAHIGFPVAAASMDFSVREGLYTSINVADNIHLGYSHFYAEVVRVKQAAEAASQGKRLLLMFDELFKGTNVKDAYDGTLSVTEAFAEYRDCLFVVSTHIIEVGEALRGNDNILFRYLPTVMEGGRPRYTYRLEEGITEDRQGMMIIRNEGILEMIHS